MTNELPQLSGNEAPAPKLLDRLDSARKSTRMLLQDTEWPRVSKGAARTLLQRLNDFPEVLEDELRIEELRAAIERLVWVMEDMNVNVGKASEKYGMRERGFMDWLKYRVALLRRRRCTDILLTSRAEVDNVLTPLWNCLKEQKITGNGREDVDTQAGAPGTIRGHVTNTSSKNEDPHALEPPGGNLNVTAESVERADASKDSASDQALAEDSPSRAADPRENHGPIREEILIAAKLAFKGVEAASGVIPVIGSYVGAAAKVGSSFVEMIENMDRNEELAQDLALHTTKLSTLLQYFAAQSKGPQEEEMATHIRDLSKEVQGMQEDVKQWNTLGRFKKAFSSSDHVDGLKGYQETVRTALEEMELLVSLNTADMILELKTLEVRREQRRLLDRLGDGKYGGRSNAIEGVTCLPGTRVEILGRIDDWIRDTAGPERVLWIRGMAGQGKSTIARTVADRWKYRASTAIFHFRRDQKTLDAQLVCALARQLGGSPVQEIKTAILETVRENEDVADQRLNEQFNILLVDSLKALRENSCPVLLIIDALDECESLDYVVDFVKLIDQHSSSFPANVKFLLTSRPEGPLLRALEPRVWRTENMDLAADADVDVERFLRHGLSKVRDTSGLPTSWPTEGDIQTLLHMSQGLFQWARTAIAYVGDGSPVVTLDELLRSASVMGGLDDLYDHILSKAFDTIKLNPGRREILSWVLGTITVVPYPVSLDVISFLYSEHDIFSKVDQEQIPQLLRQDLLSSLNSLLLIPASPIEPIRLMHTSIRDLLVDHRRCGTLPYFIDPTQNNHRLATLCLRHLNKDLKTNFFDLSDISNSSNDVQEFAKGQVTDGLRFCCLAWPIHLVEGSKAGVLDAVRDEFEPFSMQKLLCWLEIMSVIGAIAEAGALAKYVHGCLQTCNDPQSSDLPRLTALWNDTWRFIAAFQEPISYGPLHIYASALPQCPVKTKLWEFYGADSTTRIIRGQRTSTWPSNLWSRSINAEIYTVAFSPDGKTIASGSDDNSIRLWDSQTGVAIGDPLSSHGGWVYSIAFSPDGKVMASGVEDGTVQLWDSRTRAARGEPLIGHNDPVSTVSFSPDGKTIVSGSYDETIRLWDASTGTALGGPLNGHSNFVCSIAFSPDGRIIASGSSDDTIRLWDAQTGVPVGEPLVGHASTVNSVVFSPNGKIIASGSSDCTIRFWDPQTGAGWGEPLRGHTESICCVAFSPDGTLLASGSEDKTIQLWDTKNRVSFGGPLTGHRDKVLSISFSPDGGVFTSGSSDGTVRLWDTQTPAAPEEPMNDFNDAVNCAAFSPDGMAVASGFGDKAVQLWDIQTGAALFDPVQGESGFSVRSVAFSQDGKIIACGTGGGTIQLWDAQTGQTLRETQGAHGAAVYAIAFSPKGTLLVSGADDIRFWDPQTGASLYKPRKSHGATVWSLAFSPDGKIIASGSEDQTIRLWDSQTRVELGEPLRGDGSSFISVGFSPDGRYIIGVESNGAAVIFDISTFQRCNILLPLPSNGPVGFQGQWVTFLSSRLFWFPTEYWGKYDSPKLIFMQGRLAFIHDETLSVLDVSRALKL